MFLNDIAQVIYAPQKAFKKIVANPKYLGAIIILILFIALQVGFAFAQFSKIELEQTAPVGGLIQTFTNATSWTAASSINLTNNFNDYYNNTVFVANLQRPPTDPLGYYPLFGNFSLQIDAANTNTISAALFNTSNVDCSATGFKNLSMGIKFVQPQAAPQNATLTLYSLTDTNYYTYDLTSALSSASAVNQWGNVTIPVGQDATGWTQHGSPQWSNITSLTLQVDYSNNQSISIRLGALYFHGLYVTPLQYDSTGILLRFLQVYSLQFLFTWLVASGIIYLFCRGLKSAVLWKPLFVGFGFAMIVMVIRALINIAATAAMPTVYYPFDISFGTLFDPFVTLYYPTEAIGTLMAQSQATILGIEASLTAFKTIITAMFVVSYVWLGALGALIVKTLKPEFTALKSITIAAVSIGVTILALWLLIGVV